MEDFTLTPMEHTPGVSVRLETSRRFWENTDPEVRGEAMGTEFYYVAGKSVRQAQHYQYWYYWGEHTFDIRELRKAAGIKESWAFDRQYCRVYAAAKQLGKISLKHDLETLLKPLLYNIWWGDGIDFMNQLHPELNPKRSVDEFPLPQMNIILQPK